MPDPNDSVNCSMQIRTAIIKDIQHVLIRWANGDIAVLTRHANTMGQLQLTELNGELLKELKPLIQGYE